MTRDAPSDNRGGQALRASAKNAAMQTPARAPNTETTPHRTGLGLLPCDNRRVPGAVPMPPSDTKTHRIRLDSHLD